MGLIAIEQEDYGRATIYYKKALQIYEDEQDFYNASDEYHGLGKVAKAQGNYNEALAYFQKALKVRRDKQD